MPGARAEPVRQELLRAYADHGVSPVIGLLKASADDAAAL